jgi:hypothetical protein
MGAVVVEEEEVVEGELQSRMMRSSRAFPADLSAMAGG